MRVLLRNALLGLGAAGALAAAAPAWAGCGENAAVAPATWRGDARDVRLLKIANQGAQSIVGMWSVKFYVGGAMIDFGYAQWHADGTEIMNSGGRSPATQNFCLGVWTQTGPFSYHLNHFALSYNPATGAQDANVNIREDVTLDAKGTQFDGPFSIDFYDPKTNALTQHAAGRIVGRRVSAN